MQVCGISTGWSGTLNQVTMWSEDGATGCLQSRHKTKLAVKLKALCEHIMWLVLTDGVVLC